jgi:hypothetical protein
MSTVCPSFVDTPLVTEMRPWVVENFGSLLSADRVVDEIMELVDAPERTGVVRVLLLDGHAFDLQPPQPPPAAAELARRRSKPRKPELR